MFFCFLWFCVNKVLFQHFLFLQYFSKFEKLRNTHTIHRHSSQCNDSCVGVKLYNSNICIKELLIIFNPKSRDVISNFIPRIYA